MKAWLYTRWSKSVTKLGDIMLATQPPKVHAAQILDLLAVIRPGDVVCRKYSYYLDSILIPGEYSHSGFVLEPDQMAHSVAEGVEYTHPIDFVKDCDGFIVLRPAYHRSKVKLAIERAIWHVEVNRTQYDFLFNDPKSFYCHEFSADCLSFAGIEIEKTNKTFGIGPFKLERNVYLADNFITRCSIVYEYNPEDYEPTYL